MPGSPFGGDAPAIVAIMSVLQPGQTANMLVERRALRLCAVSWDGLGFTLLPRNYYLASVQRLLFLANKCDFDEFK